MPAQQLAMCQAALTQLDAGGGYYLKTFYCGFRSGWGTTNYWILNKSTNEVLSGPYGGTQCPAGDQCKARPALHQAFDGTNKTVVNAGCKYNLKSDDDSLVKVCGVWNGKQFCTGNATWTPTGETSGTVGISPDPPPPAPKVCQGGSCFDPSGNQYCAGSDSGQVCVPAPSKNSSGGCATGGSTTLCAGSPAPTPPNPPVSDPPSQIASSDKYTSQQGSNNPASNVTVNNFNGTGSGAKNGAGSGDTGAPPTSDTGNGDDGSKDDGTSASGGGDCNTPPLVEGSPALGMIARQTWLLRCADAGQGSDDSDKSVPGLEGISETPGDGIKKEISVLDKLDSSGFGGAGTCPRLPDIDLGPFGHLAMQGDWWCDLLVTARYVILLLGMWVALRILGEK